MDDFDDFDDLFEKEEKKTTVQKQKILSQPNKIDSEWDKPVTVKKQTSNWDDDDLQDA